MNPEHFLPDELLQTAQQAFRAGKQWVVYNSLSFRLQQEEVHFFKSREGAWEFAARHISDTQLFQLTEAWSLGELVQKLSLGEALYQQPAGLLPARHTFSITKENDTAMNEKNLAYLKENLRYLGFGEHLQDQLEHHIRQRFPEFVLKLETAFNSRALEAVLHYRRGEQSDMYFFNKYEATLKNASGMGAERRHSFFVHKGSGVTLKEAFNLLEGRAVYKNLLSQSGTPYRAWLQLDLTTRDGNGNYKMKQYHENYGFRLEAVLEKLHETIGIRELADTMARDRLIYSLEKGNQQAVHSIGDGGEQLLYLEAQPQYKNLNVYTEALKPLRWEVRPPEQQVEKQQNVDLLPVRQQEPEHKAREQKEKQEVKQDERTLIEKPRTIKTKKEEGLLQKKRVRQNKGLSPG